MDVPYGKVVFPWKTKIPCHYQTVQPYFRRLNYPKVAGGSGMGNQKLVSWRFFQYQVPQVSLLDLGFRDRQPAR
jgi:hypothetical protein